MSILNENIFFLLVLAPSIFRKFKQDYLRLKHAVYEAFLEDFSEGNTQLINDLRNIFEFKDLKFKLTHNGIISKTRKSTHKSQMELLDTKTQIVINNSPLQQEQKSSSSSKSVTLSNSIERTNSEEFTSEVGATFSSGFELKFFKFDAGVNFNNAHSTTTSNSVTKSISIETTITSEAQTVKINPHSKISVTTNFYSCLETIYYLVSFELNRRSYFEFNNKAWTFNERSVQGYINSTSLAIDENNVKIVHENGKFYLKNVPVITKMTTYSTETIFGEEEKL